MQYANDIMSRATSSSRCSIITETQSRQNSPGRSMSIENKSRRKRSERVKQREGVDTTMVSNSLTKANETAVTEIEFKNVSTMDQFANFLLMKQSQT
jgi:hypothetical protein